MSWCPKDGNHSNVTKRVRKRCTHLDYMRIRVRKKDNKKIAESVLSVVCSLHFNMWEYCLEDDLSTIQSS